MTLLIDTGQILQPRRLFPKPESGRIAVKVINHLRDEVVKVFRVGSEATKPTSNENVGR